MSYHHFISLSLFSLFALWAEIVYLSYHSALFICKCRGVCQSVGSCVITYFTPAAVLGLSNKTSTSVVSCWCGSVRGERLWSPIELVGVAFWFFLASGEKQNTEEGFKERSCNF